MTMVAKLWCFELCVIFLEHPVAPTEVVEESHKFITLQLLHRAIS